MNNILMAMTSVLKAIRFRSLKPSFKVYDQLIKSKEANHLIEEFMLLANEYVAKHIGEQQQSLPFVYRVHDEPGDLHGANLIARCCNGC
jgi:exoribonuclease R